MAVPMRFDKKLNVTGSLTVSGDLKIKKTNPGAGVEWKIKEQLVVIDDSSNGLGSTTGGFIEASSSVQAVALYCTGSAPTGKLQYVGFKDDNPDNEHRFSEGRGQNYFYTGSFGANKGADFEKNVAFFTHPSGGVSNFFTGSCEIDIGLEPSTTTGSILVVQYYTKFHGPTSFPE